MTAVSFRFHYVVNVLGFIWGSYSLSNSSPPQVQVLSLSFGFLLCLLQSLKYLREFRLFKV
ncbi:hypothetical protein C8Q76DRAFT_709462 [Earliella scabrosa]|nr:hypothetical protein C8Q76DRAFT_721999 [Earliella scabrosa]KAI0740948.1 hypothetical protein C8Q76DRAFT_709462 [Earliella scabrosa]